jgi:dTDP-4-amino-4,6-dideoxygalactose transaminase
MKYPYSNPNLLIIDVIAAIVSSARRSIKIIEEYYRNLTGKKYIVITNSCRTALYLAYKSILRNGDVITSPLTCKDAIDPLIESGNNPVFSDIQINDLNIDPEDIPHRINNNTIAIQVIHLGGVSCNMDKICRIAKDNNLLVIEDCAQSLGATYGDKNTGSFGDIACFSLIKNAYGIGGGVLATNSVEVYNEAVKINKKYTKPPNKLIYYRIIRNLIDTKRRFALGRLLYNSLIKLRGRRNNYQSVVAQLYRISAIEIKIAARQINRYEMLHSKRREIGKLYYNILTKKGLLLNKGYNETKSSYTKIFIYNPDISSQYYLKLLNKQDIEVMHLEQQNGSPYQNRLVQSEQAMINGLYNYDKVHDCLLSLPLNEKMNEEDLVYISTKLKNIINK